MFRYNYHPLKNKERSTLIFLILFSALIRVPVILTLGDTGLEHEWKTIIEHLTKHGVFANKNFDGFLIPNLFMPPLYAFYLYFFSLINLEGQSYVQLILSSQILLSSISVAVFYKINKIFFSEKISFFSSLIFSIFPLHVYACAQISSISLQSFLTILFFYFFFQFIKKRNFLSIFSFSLTGGLLILLRGEFIAIFILSLSYLSFFLKIEIKKILLVGLITFIVILPYLTRNILIFETVTITKSVGWNLWKGNNPYSTVEGSSRVYGNLAEQIKNIPKNKFYEINSDKVFLDEAFKNINDEPVRYLILFFKKVLSFMFIDIKSTQPNYYNPWHYLPVLFFGITSTLGIIVSNKKSHQLNYLILYFFLNIIIFSTFFILPRYKLAIIPIQIIFTNVLFNYVINKFFKSK